MKLSVVISKADAPVNAFVLWRGFEASIKKAAKMGYDGIELALGDADDVCPEELDTWLEKNGICVSCISTGLTFAQLGLYMTHPDPVKREQLVKIFHGLCDLAATRGGFLNMGRSRGFVGEGQTRAEAESLFFDTMKKVLPYAQEKGVTILIEPINRYESNFINNLDEASALLAQMESKNAGIMADLFHMNIEDDRIPDSLIRNRKYIKYIHLADSNRSAPGQGHTDFSAVLDALNVMGYDGWLSVEILPGSDPDTMAYSAVQYMKSLMQKKRL